MTRRLDLEESFLGLATDVLSLRQLSFIAEETVGKFLVQTNLSMHIADLQSQGYKVVVLTGDQYQALDFLIGHIGDIARSAADAISAVEADAVEYARLPA